MGDEGKSDDPTPLKRARRGDLKRVAEIVMVLSAMGEMRAGKDPTAVEKALAAEARERLAGVCEKELKPKDLISREAVRVVVEDLGLNRSKDPMMGFRPTKMSIAEKLMLTKRKMEESKSFAPHSAGFSSQHAPVESHGASMRQSPIAFSTGGFQSISSGVHVPMQTSITPSLKQSHVNETQLATSPLKSSTSSLEKDSPSLAQQHAGTPHLRFDGRFNGSPYLTQVQAISTDKAPTTSSVQPTSAGYVKPIQPSNVLDHTQGKSEGARPRTHDQVARSQEANISETSSAPANLPTGHQLAEGSMFVEGPSLFTNHEDISKSVQKMLQPKVFDHPNWNPPSAEYTNKPLNCQICKVPITDIESLLVCDACEKGTHLKCLQSFGNKEGIPKAEWHCPRCLIASNGKPFPPKYGRVTRTSAPQKTPSNIVATGASSDKKHVNLAAKVNQQKSVADGNAGLPVHASSSSTNNSELSRNSKTAHVMDNQSGLKKETEQTRVTSALPNAQAESSGRDKKHSGLLKIDTGRLTFEIQTGIKKEVVPSAVTPINNPMRQAGLVSAPLGAQAESSDKDIRHSGSTNCSTEHAGLVFAPPSEEAESPDEGIKHSGSTDCTREQIGGVFSPIAVADSSDKDIKHSGSIDPSTGNDGVSCASPSAEYEITDKYIKNSGLSTRSMERSTILFVVDQKVQSEQVCSENPQIETASQLQAPDKIKEMKDPISMDVSPIQAKESISPPTDKSKNPAVLQGESQHKIGCDVRLEMEVSANQQEEFASPSNDGPKELVERQGGSQHKTGCDVRLDDQDNPKASGPIGSLNINELSKPSELKENSEYEGYKILLDSSDMCDATPNGVIGNDGTRDSSKPSVPGSDAVHWLGDILQVIEEKTYHQSCQINGILHKLQDHVLVSSSSQNVLPSKLQSLWEDNRTGSKWAIVNQYYFPCDLPEVPKLPSTPVNNEVYASNEEYTIVASSICGPCEVVSAQKFKEELENRRDANSSLRQVFLCRWMYDESKGIFHPLCD